MTNGAVTDVRDLRVLIPQARRAIDGPTATGSGSVAATLNDTEILGLVADATAEVILLTGGSDTFGYQLVVTNRDAFYNAPDGWMTNQERDPTADVVIVAQAAINFFFQKIQGLKVSETISDEGQSWEYTLSAQLLRDQFAYLRALRDEAIEMLARERAPLDTFVATVANRDKMAAMFLEPYVEEIGAPVPYTGLGSAQGGYVYDFRFGTWG